ncbi:MAG: hypothetical protein WHV44_03575 [Anaerolineales bacterium]
MSAQNERLFLPPPGLFTSLSSGFEAVANHIAIILLPLGIDLLLWLGPRLRMHTLMQPVITSWTQLAQEGLLTSNQAQQMQELWEFALSRFNLFTLVRTFPVGIPSLVAGISPSDTPLGHGLDWQISSTGELLLTYALVSLVGFILGSVYLYSVARVTLRSGQNPLPAKNMAWSVTQACLVMLIWALLAFILLIPGLLIMTLLALISPLLAQFVILLALLLSVWALIPVYFSAHGVFVYGQNAFASMMQSLQLTRFTLPASSLLLIIMFIISQGLAYLWRTPPETSWLLLVGIAGHAFVSTALVAGSFVYYRDTNAWLQVMLERLKNQAPSPSAQV